MTKAFAIWLLGLAWLVGKAQSGTVISRQGDQPTLQVSGHLEDTAGSPLSHATILLLSGRDTMSTLTGDDGNFIFRNVKIRTFRLNVTMNGYLPSSKTITIGEGKNIVRLAPFVLQADYQDLDPAIVSRVRPITISGDTVSYNTAAFPVRDDAEVEDILRRLPGVEVDLDGTIIVQGKKIGKVLVNGKPFFGGDVLLATQNIPADIVSRLQIIDDYGDKARLTGIKIGESGKVLNIVLKPDKRKGLFGKVQAGAGNYGKYAQEGFGNAFQGARQMSVKADATDENPSGKDPAYEAMSSYSDQWGLRWRPAFSGGISGDNAHSAGSYTQESFYPDQQINMQQTTLTQSRNDSYNAAGTIPYLAHDGSTLRISPTYDWHHTEQQSNINFFNLEQDSNVIKTTRGTSGNHSVIRSQNGNNDIYFEKIMPMTRRRFTVQATYNFSESQETDDDLSTSNVIFNNTPSRSILHYLIFTSSGNRTFDLHGNYYIPAGNSGLVELGYNAHALQSSVNRVTQSPDSLTGSLITIDSLSLKEPYTNVTQQWHAGYEASVNTFSLSATLDGEWGRLSGNTDNKLRRYQYFALQPNVHLNWKLNGNQAISFLYQGTSAVPTIQQVTPVRNVTNPQYPVVGNPALKPYYPQTASLRYEKTKFKATQFSGFGASIGFTLIAGPIIPEIMHPKDNSQVIQSTTYVNAGRNVSVFANYHFTLPSFWHKWIRITGNGGLTHSKSLTLTDEASYVNQTLLWDQGLHIQAQVPDLLEIDVEGNYSISHSVYSSSSQVPGMVQTANFQLNARHFLFSHWVLGYGLSRLYTSSGYGLHPGPVSLTASLRQEFLAHHKASIVISCNNLLNSGASVSQTVTPASIIQTQTEYVGRLFMVKFVLRMQHF